MNKTVKFFSLITLALIVVRLLFAAFTPVFDTSEARYAAISANMARTGDYLVPRFTHRGVYQSFDGKPPLLFQLSAASTKVFGINEFAVRLPVLAFTILLLAIVFASVKILAEGDSSRAWAAVALTISSVAYYFLAGLTMMDGILVASVSGAILAHVALLKSRKRAWSLAVFSLLAVGMLVKGPVAIVEFGLGVFLDTLLNKRWQDLKLYYWGYGLGLFFVISAPWFILMTRENPGFLKYFFINENLLRFLVHDYGDKYGAGRETFRGMAIIWALVVTMPYSLYALFKGCRKPDSAIGWSIIAITAFWSLTSRVPIAYLMPVVPLFAAHLALGVKTEDFAILKRFVILASIVSVVTISAVTTFGIVFTDKMQGAAAPYKLKRYSYEFYHGTLPESMRQ